MQELINKCPVFIFLLIMLFIEIRFTVLLSHNSAFYFGDSVVSYRSKITAIYF